MPACLIYSSTVQKTLDSHSKRNKNVHVSRGQPSSCFRWGIFLNVAVKQELKNKRKGWFQPQRGLRLESGRREFEASKNSWEVKSINPLNLTAGGSSTSFPSAHLQYAELVREPNRAFSCLKTQFVKMKTQFRFTMKNCHCSENNNGDRGEIPLKEKWNIVCYIDI